MTNSAVTLEPQSSQPAEQKVASWLQVPDEASLPDAVRDLFEHQRQAIGQVHPYFRGLALIPEHLLLWNAYYEALMYGPGELSPKEREFLAVVASAANHCESCVTTHKAQLRSVTGDSALADAIATDYTQVDLTARERALLDFAVKVSTLASPLSPEDLEPLRQAGLSDKAILEGTEIVAQFSLANRLTKAFGWKVGPEFDQLFR